MPEPRTPDQVRRQIKRIRTARWVLVAISALLAVALLVHGNVVIGLLVGVLAGMRAWMLITMPRRMQAMREHRREAFTRHVS